MGFGRDDNRPEGGRYFPLTIRYIDQNDQLSAPQGVLRSQEMSTMEVMQGALYIPAEDFEGDDFNKCNDQVCTQGNFDPVESSHHVYATAEYDGAVYMVGSSGSTDCTATVWKSSDGGFSWSIELTMSKDNGFPGCARFSLTGVVNNKLYVQGYQYDYSEAGEAPCAIDDDESKTCNWRIRPDVYTLDQGVWSHSLSNPVMKSTFHYRTVPFLGKMFFKGGRYELNSFHNDVRESIRNDVLTFSVSGEWLYVLTSSRDVFRTKNLVDWNFLDRAPVGSLSMEIANNAVYVGTNDGQVFKSLIPEPPEPKEFQFVKYNSYLIPIASQ